MNDSQHRFDDDDQTVPMTMDERTVWAYLLTVVVTSGTYAAVIITRMLNQPIEEISWVTPMLWTIGVSVVGTVLGTIVATVGGAVGQAVRVGPRAAECAFDEPSSDLRDREINRHGQRASAGVLGVGLGAGLVLAMLDADTFWIGNLLFLSGMAGALVETTTKIHLYRRGF